MAGRPWVAVAVLLAVGGISAACDDTPRDTTETATTSTFQPVSAQQQARDAVGSFNVELPADARQIKVVTPPLDDFRAKSLVSFVAPRQQVIDQTCRGLEFVVPDQPPPLIAASFEGQILEYAGVTIDRNAYGYCDQYEGGRKILVLVPRAEGATTYVVLYHVPYR